MVFKSIIGATCACLAVISFNVSAASVSYYDNYGFRRNMDMSISVNNLDHSRNEKYTKDLLVGLDTENSEMWFEDIALNVGGFSISFTDEFTVGFGEVVSITTTLNLNTTQSHLISPTDRATLTPTTNGEFEIGQGGLGNPRFEGLLLSGSYNIAGPTETMTGDFILPFLNSSTRLDYTTLDASSYPESLDIISSDSGNPIAYFYSSSDIFSGSIDGVDYITSIDNLEFDKFTRERELLTPSTVPVPAAVWLFGSGLIGLIGIARRKVNA